MNQNKPSYEELEQEIASLKNKIKLDKAFLEILFDAIPSPIFYKDNKGIYINCNDAFSQKILGIKKADIEGKSLYDFPELIPIEHAKIYEKKDSELLASKQDQFYSTNVKCSDGEIKHFNFYKAIFKSDENEALGIIGIMMDITEQKEKEKELKKLAFNDPLTNLFNRRHFIESSKNIIALSKRESNEVSILILDIDDFKLINDRHGHENGDNVIIFITKKLKEICRESDLIARWGGEEFVILLPNTNQKGALKVASQIKEVISSHPISMAHGSSIKTTVSIGVSQIQNEDNNFEPALQKADQALYKAKKGGKNKIVTV